jgi:hypothetical protein
MRVARTRPVTDGMATLWQAVLLRAVMDGLGQGYVSYGRAGATRAQVEADAWLRRAGRDMQHVCALAGYDPDALRDAYLRTLAAQATTGRRVIFGNGVRSVDPRLRQGGVAA